MRTRILPTLAQTYQAVAMWSGDRERGAKGEAVERPENRGGCGLGSGSRPDHDEGAELCSCTERNWRSDNDALKSDHSRLTGKSHVVGGWAVVVLDRKAANEWALNDGSYWEEMRVNDRVVGTSLWANPKLHEGMGYVEGRALGQGVLG